MSGGEKMKQVSKKDKGQTARRLSVKQPWRPWTSSSSSSFSSSNKPRVEDEDEDENEDDDEHLSTALTEWQCNRTLTPALSHPMGEGEGCRAFSCLDALPALSLRDLKQSNRSKTCSLSHPMGEG